MFKTEIKEIIKPSYEVAISFNSMEEAQEASKFFDTLNELRRNGAKNLSYCLAWRQNCTSKGDKNAVDKVGVEKVYQAYSYFAKCFGTDE